MKLRMAIFGLAFGFTMGAFAQDSTVALGAATGSNASAAAERDDTRLQAEGATAAGARAQRFGVSAADTFEMNATLSKPVDSRKAKPGDEVMATLAVEARGAGGVTLPRGTKLIGHVTEAQPSAQRSRAAGAIATAGAESRLGIAFDKAILEDGREVPIVATIEAIAGTEAAAAEDASGFAGPPAGAGTFGSGRVGSGLIGGVTGTLGGAIGGPSNLGGGLGGAETGSAARSTANAAGGLNGIGRLTPGSRGVFGLHGVALAPAEEPGARGAAVLTSATGNVTLGRGTQLLLVGSAATAIGPASGGSAVSGSAAGRASRR